MLLRTPDTVIAVLSDVTIVALFYFRLLFTVFIISRSSLSAALHKRLQGHSQLVIYRLLFAFLNRRATCSVHGFNLALISRGRSHAAAPKLRACYRSSGNASDLHTVGARFASRPRRRLCLKRFIVTFPHFLQTPVQYLPVVPHRLLLITAAFWVMAVRICNVATSTAWQTN